ncbi:hypothetical protein M407DRAFT_20494 [Tulasnella calospora MUT 4182]|uniref:Uncharacterized protein n=1 Tax=Tulasnella calospora MUT 4182 TaxID=1051891 RepID=A0A0C3QFZ2_9AGAM|nr:hypothetical protein M407DRAFT_20494 [Tulasnella calospora MUT 4182]
MLPNRSFFRKIGDDVKLSDRQYVKNEKERYISISVNPFWPKDKVHPNKESEPPSEWLELAGDLAWTASFSALMNNTTITGSKSVWNYIVFFALTWHLWATQTTYDIRYYTNDWWHRILFASQLAIYAMLAALSGSFNMGWQLSSDARNLSGENINDLTNQAIHENEMNSMVKTFEGINIVLFASRLFLFAQYLRVIVYRSTSDHFRKSDQIQWGFCLPAASTFVAAFIFLGCFFLVKERNGSLSVAAIQLSLWGLAMAVQVLAAAFTPEDGQNVLKRRGRMAPRLATLTVIIMGKYGLREGLNRICGTLRHSINALGLTGTMILEAISVLIVLYFLWLLYFDGFQFDNEDDSDQSNPPEGSTTEGPSDKQHDNLWLWSHFLLHLSLVMTLEGTKNIFLYAHVNRAIDLLTDGFNHVVEQSNNFTNWPEDTELEKLLLPLQMSWHQEANVLKEIATNGTVDSQAVVRNQLGQYYNSTLYEMYLLFNEEPNSEAEQLLNPTSSTSVDFNLMRDAFKKAYNELFAYGVHWVIAVSGVLLIVMAVVNFLRRRPRNRFAWGYILSRAVLGVSLIIIGGTTSKLVSDKTWLYWIIPTIAIAYGLETVIEWILLCFSHHSIEKKEKEEDEKKKEEEEKKKEEEEKKKESESKGLRDQGLSGNGGGASSPEFGTPVTEKTYSSDQVPRLNAGASGRA